MNFTYTYQAPNFHSEEFNLSYMKYIVRTQMTSMNFTNEENKYK